MGNTMVTLMGTGLKLGQKMRFAKYASWIRNAHIYFLVLFLKPQMSFREVLFICSLSDSHEGIIEFGSGQSTRIWARFFRNVLTVESRLEWFREIRSRLSRRSVTSVFAPPESSAFGTQGEELWNTRVPSDYGMVAEFSRHLKLATSIIADASPNSVFFVDGQLREQLGKAILAKSNFGILAVHDVTPDRNYLNAWLNDKDLGFPVQYVGSLAIIRSSTRI
jgi:hypothetical protein